LFREGNRDTDGDGIRDPLDDDDDEVPSLVESARSDTAGDGKPDPYDDDDDGDGRAHEG
jgi:hypothetical protein